jgi:DNA-binding NarL/FixJ family response regulator
VRTSEPTERELEVLRAVTEPGASHVLAAERLGISPSTIKGTLRTLYLKLNVRSAGQAVRVLAERETVPDRRSTIPAPGGVAVRTD